jgi:hypothetical protein
MHTADFQILIKHGQFKRIRSDNAMLILDTCTGTCRTPFDILTKEQSAKVV